MDNKKDHSFAIPFALVAAAIAMISRWIPHLPNFTAMEGITLFAGAYLGWRALAVIGPMMLWYFSDWIINNTVARSFYPDQEGIIWYADYMPWVYISILLVVLLGAKMLSKWTPSKLILTSVGATVVFWVLSNIGTWLAGTLYAKTAAGLGACFTAAIPFIQTSAISNLVYVALLFGGYELIYHYRYKRTAQLV